MTKPTHINVWFLVLFLLILYNPQFSIFMLLTPFLAVLPDADHWEGFLSRKLHIKAIVNWALNVKHRWITHTLLFPIVFTLLIYYIALHFFNYQFSQWDLEVLIILILSHILGDIFTISWIQAFYPIPLLKNITVRVWNIRTTKDWEFIFSFVVLLINFYLVYLVIHNWWFKHLFSSFLEYYNQNQHLVLNMIIGILIFNMYLFSMEIFWIDTNKEKMSWTEKKTKTTLDLIIHSIILFLVWNLYVNNYEYINSTIANFHLSNTFISISPHIDNLIKLSIIWIVILFILYIFIADIYILFTTKWKIKLFAIWKQLSSILRDTKYIFIKLLLYLILAWLLIWIDYYILPQYLPYVFLLWVIIMLLWTYNIMKEKARTFVPTFIYMIIWLFYIALTFYAIYLKFKF